MRRSWYSAALLTVWAGCAGVIDDPGFATKGAGEESGAGDGSPRPDACAGSPPLMPTLAHFLSALDHPELSVEANGETILDNSLVVIATELGNHGASHSCDEVFHAVVGGEGRVRRGQVRGEQPSAADLYGTVLRAAGVERPIGDPAHRSGLIDDFLEDVPLL